MLALAGARRRDQGAPSLTHTKGPSAESAPLAIPPSETRWTPRGRGRGPPPCQRCRVVRNSVQLVQPALSDALEPHPSFSGSLTALLVAYATFSSPARGATIACQLTRLVIVPRQPQQSVFPPKLTDRGIDLELSILQDVTKCVLT